MVRKRTPHVGEAVGNEQALIVEQLTHFSSVELEHEPVLEGVLIEAIDLSGVEAASVQLVEVALRRTDLGGTQLRGLHLLDVLMSSVNAANGSWPYARMSRATFDSSTLVGIDLANAQVGSTTFSECKLDLANFRASSFHDVVFAGCSLRGADFYGAKLESVRFEKCDLHEIDLSQAELDTVDLRTSALTGIRGTGSLRGAIIDGGQLIELASSLAAELGIHVENLDERA